MSRVVYDSSLGRVCLRCQRALDKCNCSRAAKPRSSTPQNQPLPQDGVVRVRRELRRGKGLLVILGLPLDDAALHELAKLLKKKCGAGGSVKDGAIELQGDGAKDAVIAELESRGFRVKWAGG